MPEATLRGIHLIVRDVAATVAFYRRAGLEFESVSKHFARVASDRAALEIGSYELTRGYDTGFREPPGGGSTALQIGLASREAVDTAYADLTAEGYTGHLPPFDAFWGARYAEVRDPDGNLVGFQSPVDESRKSAPPA
ncbi:MAG: VOC family protein, partial [Chloroflexi bacterium]|nr:VOC family protein [Chloroflexota bacterium]